MLRKWTLSTIVHFLELYEERPCLWNYQYETYKDRHAREEALLEIANYMRKIEPDCDINIVKAKIRSLRNAYINEHNKVLRSQRNGASGNNVYKPTLGWYATADRFLKHVVESKGATFDDDDCIEIKEDSVSFSSPGSSMLEQPQQVPQTCKKRKYSFCGKETEERPKSKQNVNVDAVTEAVAALREITEKVEELKQDELDAFGKTVVAYLRKMPEDISLDCQAEIINYLISQKKALLQTEIGHDIQVISGESCSSE